MIKFKSWQLKGTVPFKNTKVKFIPGLTTIYGLNKTSKGTRNGNGAGKSRLFSSMHDLLFDTPLVGEKSDRIKEGVQELCVQVNNDDITVTRKGNKYKANLNGKEIKFRTVALAKQWVGTHIPINEECADTFLYLDSRVPHPLVMGKSTTRRDFFTSFFSLNKLDVQRKIFQAELAKINKSKAQYQEVLTEYRQSKSELGALVLTDDIEGRIESLQSELNKLHKRNTRIQELRRLKTLYDSLKVALAKVDLNIDVPAKFKVARMNLEAAKAYNEYERDTKAYKKAYSGLKYKALIDKYTVEELESKATKVQTASRKLKSLEEEIEELKSQLTEVKAVEDPKVDEGETVVALKAIEHQLDHARRFKTGTCTECGQEVKVRDVKELAKTQAKLEAKLEKLALYKEYKRERDAQKNLKSQIAKLKASVEGLQESAAKKKFVAAYKEAISLPEKPEKYKGEAIDLADAEAKFNTWKTRLEMYELCKPHVQDIEDYLNLSEADAQLLVSADKIETQINKKNEELSKLRGLVEAHNIHKTRIKRLKARLLEVKEDLKYEEALKLLVEGFGDKAIKKIAINAICARLQTAVNHYAKIVFQENYQFEFIWDTELKFIVHRKYGGKNKSSDVRKLSGAESKLFTIILVLALLSVTPKSRRTSLLILDEPTANFSPETTANFQLLIPVLLKVVPSIVIITPDSTERYEDATEMTVVKENGVSSLIKGHPYALINK